MSAIAVSSAKFRPKLSTPAERMVAVEKQRLIHRVLQSQLAAAVSISTRWYRRLVGEPTLASEPLVAQLETAVRGFALSRAISRKPVCDRLPAAFGGFFVLACGHYHLDAAAARARLQGEERPADTVWRASSHARQAALYLVNQALGVPQSELAAFAGISPAAVCLGLRQVEDRRDDPAFDMFLEQAQLQVLG